MISLFDTLQPFAQEIEFDFPEAVPDNTTSTNEKASGFAGGLFVWIGSRIISAAADRAN